LAAVADMQSEISRSNLHKFQTDSIRINLGLLATVLAS